MLKLKSESYAHAAARATLVSWFREAAKSAGGYDANAECLDFEWRVNRGAPTFGIYPEFPLVRNVNVSYCKDCLGDVQVLDENGYAEIPTYEQLMYDNCPPQAILDVAMAHKGNIFRGFEICHRHPVSAEKSAYLATLDVAIYEISAEWILNQKSCPKRLDFIRIHGGYCLSPAEQKAALIAHPIKENPAADFYALTSGL